MNRVALSQCFILFSLFLWLTPSHTWACTRNGKLARSTKQCCSKFGKRVKLKQFRKKIYVLCAKKPIWNQNNVQQAITRARQSVVQKKQRSNKSLQDLRSSLSSHLDKLKKGICRSKRIKLPDVKCKKKCKFGKCVKVCKPVIRKRKIEMCMSSDGMKFKGPNKWLSFEIKDLKKKYRKLKREKDKIQDKTKKLAKDIAKKSIKAFKKALAKFEKRAKAMAQKLSQNKTFRNPIVQLVTKKLAVKSYGTWNTFKSQKSGSVMKEIREALAKENNRDELNKTMRSKQQRQTRLKSYGKTAAIAIGLAVGVNALKVTYKCWQYQKQDKRLCLNKEVALGLRDASFDTLAGLLQGAIDIELIEPSSHTMAGTISSALASLTVGIGAAAYPVAYLASSVALNVVLSLIIEKQGRKRYNTWFESKVGADTRRFSVNLVKKIPDSWMRCYSHCQSQSGSSPRPRPTAGRPNPSNAHQKIYMYTLAHGKKCLDAYFNGNGVHMVSCRKQNNRLWTLYRDGTLRNELHRGKCLEAPGAGKMLRMVRCNQNARQRWYLKYQSNLKAYRILSRYSNLCLDAYTTGGGAHIVRCHNGRNQFWRLSSQLQ